MISKFLQSALELREQLDEATSSEHLRTLRLEVQQWIDGLVREFKIDYGSCLSNMKHAIPYKLRFFQRVLNDIDKAEDQLLDDRRQF